jgi:CysZ protein
VSAPTRSAPPEPPALRHAADGLAVHAEGLRMLRREQSLWKLALVPLAITLVAFTVAVALVVAYLDWIHALATAWMPVLEATAWYAWLWVGPLKLVFFVIGVVLTILLVGLAMAVAFLVANVLASPFLDALSRRVEALVEGRVQEADSGFFDTIREGGRAMSEELRRLFFFGIVQAIVFVLGLLIPGGQVLTAPVMVGITILFLPLDYASYTLDRRRVRFRDKRQWVMSHRLAMIGFGAGAFATLVVPGLNFLALPALVVSGTLLALRYPALPKA